MKAEVLIGGASAVAGPLLRLDEPLSFWGGVDPATGRLSDPRSERYGRLVAGTVLMIRELRGSSSSSGVVLELIYRGIAPVAIILGETDAIVGLGILVAGELGLARPPLLRLDPQLQSACPEACITTVARDGTLSFGLCVGS